MKKNSSQHKLVFDLIHFKFLRDAIIYHVYIYHDFLIDVFFVVPSMDPNAAVLIELTRLMSISAYFRSSDEIRRSLASTMDVIFDTISLSADVLYDVTSYRERKRHIYVDRLHYIAIRRLKITKGYISSLFRDPRNGEITNTNKPHISIE